MACGAFTCHSTSPLNLYSDGGGTADEPVRDELPLNVGQDSPQYPAPANAARAIIETVSAKIFFMDMPLFLVKKF
jgi:hypothetical protein